MSTQNSLLLCLPYLPFRQIIDNVATLDNAFALSTVIHLRRVCKRFDHELTNTIFAQKLAKIRSGTSRVAHIFPLMRRKVLERFRAGTLDESGLHMTIVHIGRSLQENHNLFKELDQDAVFQALLDIAVENFGPDETMLRLFGHDSPLLDPEQTKAHTIVVATYMGEYEVVRCLLSQGVDPNIPSSYFGSALSVAARRGYCDILKLLLESGADLHTVTDTSKTAVAAAIDAGHEDIIQILLQAEYKHPTSGDIYNYALKRSAERNLISTVFLLLKCASPDPSESLYYEILLAASSNGCLPLVKAMVEKGVDVTRPRNNKSPLVLSAQGGHNDVTCYLLDQGAPLDVSSPLVGDPITAAATHGHTSTINLLLKYGANVNSRLGPRGTTPMFEAARHNRADAVRLLLEAGAVSYVMQDDIMINLGYSAFESAIQKGQKEIVQALVEGGMDAKTVPPDRKDKDPPPVILAKMWGQTETVTLLLTLGATDLDPLDTQWAEDFRRGVYPKSAWTLRSQRTG